MNRTKKIIGGEFTSKNKDNHVEYMKGMGSAIIILFVYTVLTLITEDRDPMIEEMEEMVANARDKLDTIFIDTEKVTIQTDDGNSIKTDIASVFDAYIDKKLDINTDISQTAETFRYDYLLDYFLGSKYIEWGKENREKYYKCTSILNEYIHAKNEEPSAEPSAEQKLRKFCEEQYEIYKDIPDGSNSEDIYFGNSDINETTQLNTAVMNVLNLDNIIVNSIAEGGVLNPNEINSNVASLTITLSKGDVKSENSSSGSATLISNEEEPNELVKPGFDSQIATTTLPADTQQTESQPYSQLMIPIQEDDYNELRPKTPLTRDTLKSTGKKQFFPESPDQTSKPTGTLKSPGEYQKNSSSNDTPPRIISDEMSVDSDKTDLTSEISGKPPRKKKGLSTIIEEGSNETESSIPKKSSNEEEKIDTTGNIQMRL